MNQIFLIQNLNCKASVTVHLNKHDEIGMKCNVCTSYSISKNCIYDSLVFGAILLKYLIEFLIYLFMLVVHVSE